MMPLNLLGKSLIVLGVLLALVGLAILLRDRAPVRQILDLLPLGRLPGDVNVERPGFSFHFPWVTCLLVSVVASVILWLLRR